MFKTIAFFIFFIIGLSAYAQDKGRPDGNQLFTFEFADTPVKQVFSYIQEHSDYVFLYYGGVIDDSRKVTISVNNEDINGVLQKIFRRMPVDYEIHGRQITLKKKSTSVGKSQEVRGIVKDEVGMPLIGATVVIKSPAELNYFLTADFDFNVSQNMFVRVGTGVLLNLGALNENYGKDWSITVPLPALAIGWHF